MARIILSAVAILAAIVWLQAPGSDAGATFPGAVGKVAYSVSQIYVMGADGTNQTPITSSGQDSQPAWSPNGGKIAFTSFRDGNYEIYVMNADGSNQTRLTTNTVADFTPAWSSDGTKLLFMSERDGNREIYKMDANGVNPIRLTTNSAIDQDPSWQSGGNKIAFSSIRDGNFEIYEMNSDGSNQTRITFTALESEGAPVWSADGTKLLFPRGCGGSGCAQPGIITANADGSGYTPIVLAPANSGYLRAVWLPDMSRIIASRLTLFPQTRSIYSFDAADGSDEQQLTTEGDGPDAQPVVGVGGVTSLPSEIETPDGSALATRWFALSSAVVIAMVARLVAWVRIASSSKRSAAYA